MIISNGRPLAFSHLVDAAASTSDDAPSFSSMSVMPNRQSVKPLNQVVAEHISLALKVARGQVEGKRGASVMLEGQSEHAASQNAQAGDFVREGCGGLLDRIKLWARTT